MRCKNEQIYSPFIHCFLSEHNVHTEWSEIQQKRPNDMLKMINKYWDSLPKKSLFNNKLVRLNSWALTANRCTLYIGATDYSTLLFSNKFSHEIIVTWGEIYLSRALGVSAVIVSSDNKLLMIKRSKDVGEFPDYFDIVGGHIDISEMGQEINVFHSMKTELIEELNLKEQEYTIQLVGLLETAFFKKPELVFYCQTSKAIRSIIQCARSAKDAYEYSELFWLENSAAAIKKFLKIQKDKCCPSAFGSLCLYLKTIQKRDSQKEFV